MTALFLVVGLAAARRGAVVARIAIRSCSRSIARAIMLAIDD
jgi:hypothetical protein